MSTMIETKDDVPEVSNVSNIIAAVLNQLRLEFSVQFHGYNIDEMVNFLASIIMGSDVVNANVANVNNDITAAGLFFEFKEAISIIMARHLSGNSDVNQLKILRGKIGFYAQFFFKFFKTNGSEDLQFQLNVFPEVLMDLAKLTAMGVTLNTNLDIRYHGIEFIEMDEYIHFCQLLIYYADNFYTVGKTTPQLNLVGKTYDERLSLETKAKEDNRSIRLIEFLRARDSNFLEICGKHLLYTAVKEYVPEIFDYIPNAQDLIQQGIYLERRWGFSFETYIGTTTLTLFDFFLRTPSVISKNRLETTFNFLLNNGLNVFNCGGSPNKPRSCLNFPKDMMLLIINHAGKIEQFRMINLTYLTLLENGAGCLRRDARHVLQPSTELLFLPYSPLQYGSASTLQDLILWGVSQPLFEAKQISETALQFTKRLIDSELVFKVPGQMRFIFCMKEFDEYIQNFDKLSIQEKINLRRMCESFIRLNDEERALLAPGFETTMTALQEKMGISIDSFETNVSTIFSSVGLPGNAKSSVQAIIFSYLVIKDIDESNIPLPTLSTLPVQRSLPTRGINGISGANRGLGPVNGIHNGSVGTTGISQLALMAAQIKIKPQSGPSRLPVRIPQSQQQRPLAHSQPQPTKPPAQPVRIFRIAGNPENPGNPRTSVTPATQPRAANGLAPVTIATQSVLVTTAQIAPVTIAPTEIKEDKAEKSFVEIQQEKRKPGNKQYADTINFVEAYMSLNPDKKTAAELNHPRFKPTLELTYRGLPLSEKIKLDQKIDQAKRAKASAAVTTPVPAKRPGA